MKAIFKNFIHVLRRSKTASALNILGLSAALVVFTICAIQTHYDLTFNRNLKNVDRLYQLSFCQETNYGKAWWYNMSYKYSDIVKLNQPMFDESNMVRVICVEGSDIKYEKNGEQLSSNAAVTSVEPQFLDIIGMDIIEGNGKNALNDINKVIISKKTAERFFGNESPIGKSLLMYMPITFEYENGGIGSKWEEVPMTIAAVYKDFTTNTSFTNGLFTRLKFDRYERFSADGRSSVSAGGNFSTFCLLNAGVTRDAAEKVLSDKKLLDMLYLNPPRVEDIKDAQGEGQIEVLSKDLKLLPLSNIQLNYPKTVHGKARSKGSVLSLLAIGVVALLIAYINFINFITAMAPMRIRSINIQKIMGARRISLSFSIIFETLIFTILSFTVALLIVHFISTSSLSEFFTANLQLKENVGLFVPLGFILILISVLMASYPAYNLTSFNPITTYGGATMGQKGKQLRSVLTTIQFIAACVLIMVAFFIKLQHEYFKSYDLGIDKENVVVVTNHNSTFEPLLSNVDVYMQEVSTVDGITDSTAADFQFGGFGIGGMGRSVDGKQVQYSNISVAKNFFDFFDIKILEGADLVNDKNQDRIYVANKTMLDKYGTDVLSSSGITNGRFAVANDFNYLSLYENISPLLRPLQSKLY